MNATSYKRNLNKRYWHYVSTHFPKNRCVFDPKHAQPNSPPVFKEAHADRNLLVDSQCGQCRKALIQLIRPAQRHRWFRSMNSSQALAQSVFGNLKISNSLGVLKHLADQSGNLLFAPANCANNKFVLEHGVKTLNEPTPTSLDAFMSGKYQVAIECKFTESDVGQCSQPDLLKDNPDYCDGTYKLQQSRQERCPLTAKGISYWKHVPKLFNWAAANDLVPCPLHRNYQLVRNILAACVDSNGTACPENGHAILFYDERNPAFSPGGPGHRSFIETRKALLDSTLLRRCSWQELVSYLKNAGVLPQLTKELHDKYGF